MPNTIALLLMIASAVVGGYAAYKLVSKTMNPLEWF